MTLISTTQWLQPITSSSSLMHILHSAHKVLPYPWIIRISHSMLGTNLSHFGSNEWIPRTAHPLEQVMLHLKVQSTSQSTCNKSTICRRSLHLRFEPTDGFSRFTLDFGGITINMFKIVTQCEETRKCE